MQPPPTVFRRLLVFVLVALLPLTAVIGFTLYRQFQSDRTRVLDQLQVLTETNARQLATYVVNTRHKLKTLAAEEPVINRQGEDSKELFHRFVSFNPRFVNIALFDRSGQVLLEANHEPLGTESIANFKAILSQNEAQVSEPYQRGNGGRWTCLVSYPMTLADGTRGTLLAALDLKQFASLLAVARSLPHFSVEVLDANSGAVVIRLPDNDATVGWKISNFDRFIRDFKAQPDDPLHYTGADGSDYTGRAVLLEGTPWIVNATAPTAVILQAAWGNFWRSLFGFALFFLIAVWLIWRYALRIGRPIRALAKAARTQTPVADIPPDAPIEITETLRAFNAMLETTSQAESSLAASEHRYRTVIDQTGQMIYDYDAANARVSWFGSNAIKQITGYTPEEYNAMGVQGWENNLHPEDREAAIARLRNCILTGRPCHAEYRMRHKDGSYRMIEEQGVVLTDANGKNYRMLGCMVDITARREADRALSEAKSQLQAIIGTLDGIVWEVDTDTMQFTYVSPQAERILGYPADQWITEKDFWIVHMHPDDATWAPAYCVTETDNNRDHNFEYRMIAADGRTVWLHDVVSLVREKGRTARLRGVMVDITKRKQAEAERARLESKLHEAQKLEQIGVLAGGIAHDFNNLLTTILGHASLARLTLPTDTPAGEALDQIRKASLRAAELCRQMLAYAGKGRLEMEPIDLNTLIEGTTKLLEVTISRRAELNYRPGTPLPAINADPTQLRQVIMNLVINASEAINGPQGRITIATGMTTANAAELRDYLIETTPGNYVWLEVTDNGVGMSSETLAQIFNPFFTTKETGSGLGLAAILGIVRSHQGTIRVYSALGEGSTFRILLPAAKTKAVSSEPPFEAGEKSSRGQGRLLVIDDDAHVRLIINRALTHNGYHIDEAEDGLQGLAQFKTDPKRYDGILLDLTMPHLSGQETLQRLRALRADIPVLLISGYSRQSAASDFASNALTDFLQKPFDVGSLLTAVKKLLTTNAG